MSGIDILKHLYILMKITENNFFSKLTRYAVNAMYNYHSFKTKTFPVAGFLRNKPF